MGFSTSNLLILFLHHVLLNSLAPLRLNVHLAIATTLQLLGIFSCKAAFLQIPKLSLLDNVQKSTLNFLLFSAVETEVKLNTKWPQGSQATSRLSPSLTQG